MILGATLRFAMAQKKFALTAKASGLASMTLRAGRAQFDHTEQLLWVKLLELTWGQLTLSSL